MAPAPDRRLAQTWSCEATTHTHSPPTKKHDMHTTHATSPLPVWHLCSHSLYRSAVWLCTRHTAHTLQGQKATLSIVTARGKTRPSTCSYAPPPRPLSAFQAASRLSRLSDHLHGVVRGKQHTEPAECEEDTKGTEELLLVERPPPRQPVAREARKEHSE